MSNYHVPCFYRINFVVIPSYIELPWWHEHYVNIRQKSYKICLECVYILILLRPVRSLRYEYFLYLLICPEFCLNYFRKEKLNRLPNRPAIWPRKIKFIGNLKYRNFTWINLYNSRNKTDINRCARTFCSFSLETVLFMHPLWLFTHLYFSNIQIHTNIAMIKVNLVEITMFFGIQSFIYIYIVKGTVILISNSYSKIKKL